ncbi:MAG: SDR family oxidoreductase [Bdellovibrionales bacterium]|nr:SDR family oxidoreductase [Bdellovibrionales bacterium]
MAKVLINGTNRGIGLELVKKFLSEGHDVYAACRTASEELKATKAKIFEKIDVTDEYRIETLLSEIPNIDILINNAGILKSETLENLNFNNITEQFEVNTLGPLKFISTLLPKLTNGSKIGIVSSKMGSVSDNTSGAYYGYRISKCAVNMMAKSLSEDLKSQGIAVLILHPGFVRTDMTGGQGFIDPPESAEGLYKIMIEKSIKETGTFWHTNGENIDW